MNIISIKLNTQQIETLVACYQQYQVTPPPYALYQFKPHNCTITVYQSQKVVFQGKEAEECARPFNLMADIAKPSVDQVGSDECGTGDYFGPVCVCACLIKSSDIPYLNQLNIIDSKRISDADILTLAPKLMRQLTYSLLILEPLKYNQVHQTYNMNAIKALLHNKALLNLQQKIGKLPQLVVIDQFTPVPSYFRYLKKEPQVIRQIHFETKAEDKFLAVAAASIIGRYTFINKLQQLGEHYNNWSFPKGAGPQVDENAKAFVKTFGQEQLQHVAKMHFANTKRIIEDPQ